jgi:hypothetical protein
MSEQTKRAPAAAAATRAPAGFKVNPDHIDAKPGEGVRSLRRPAPDPNEPTETGIVARGRSVHCGGTDDEKHMVGMHPISGEPIYVPVQTQFGPGMTVTLPRSEIARLREMGFLEDSSDDE